MLREEQRTKLAGRLEEVAREMLVVAERLRHWQMNPAKARDQLRPVFMALRGMFTGVR